MNKIDYVVREYVVHYIMYQVLTCDNNALSEIESLGRVAGDLVCSYKIELLFALLSAQINK